MGYSRNITTHQGRARKKVSGLDVLLTSRRKEILDEMQRGTRVTGVLQHGGAETNWFAVEGLPCVRGEMDLGVGCRHRRIAQIDLIGEQQVRQFEIDSRAQIEV